MNDVDEVVMAFWLFGGSIVLGILLAASQHELLGGAIVLLGIILLLRQVPFDLLVRPQPLQGPAPEVHHYHLSQPQYRRITVAQEIDLREGIVRAAARWEQ